MKTLVVAIPLPPSARKSLQRLCCGLPDALWTEENSLHIALRIYRTIDGNNLLDIQESLSQFIFSPFQLTLQGVDTHWTKAKGATIWIKVPLTAALEKLQKDLAKLLKDVKAEQVLPAHNPHVPLCKCRGLAPQRLAAYMEAAIDFHLPPFEVKALQLLSCQATDKHLIYNVVEEFPAKPS